MKVWWCEEHRAASAPDDDHELCEVAGMVNFLEAMTLERPCRLVEMQLVPADALVIEKENGEWPEWITDVDGPIWHQCGSTYGLLDEIVEAITERAKPEPPKDPWDYDP